MELEDGHSTTLFQATSWEDNIFLARKIHFGCIPDMRLRGVLDPAAC